MYTIDQSFSIINKVTNDDLEDEEDYKILNSLKGSDIQEILVEFVKAFKGIIKDKNSAKDLHAGYSKLISQEFFVWLRINKPVIYEKFINNAFKFMEEEKERIIPSQQLKAENKELKIRLEESESKRLETERVLKNEIKIQQDKIVELESKKSPFTDNKEAAREAGIRGSESRGTIKALEKDQDFKDLLKSRIEQGDSLRKIANFFNSTKYTPPRGSLWSHNTVKRFIQKTNLK